MTTDQNKALYRRFIEKVFNEGQLEVIDDLLAPSYIFHDAPPGLSAGPEGVKRIASIFRKAFPDLEIAIEDQVAEGDMVCTRTILRGTHKGVLYDIQPTGKVVHMTGLAMVRMAGGRLAESWVKNDVQGLMRQLGAPREPLP